MQWICSHLKRVTVDLISSSIKKGLVPDFLLLKQIKGSFKPVLFKRLKILHYSEYLLTFKGLRIYAVFDLVKRFEISHSKRANVSRYYN